MLTDTKLRNLKPKSKLYKAFDRDGMYVTVSPTGTVTFRYDYRLNGRRETLTIGRYGPTGISLAMAREKLLDAKRMVELGGGTIDRLVQRGGGVGHGNRLVAFGASLHLATFVMRSGLGAVLVAQVDLDAGEVVLVTFE